MGDDEPIKAHNSFLLFSFPDDKRKIGKLSLEQKMEWYAHQIQFAGMAGQAPIHLMSKEFEKFWKWRVLIPTKFKRFYFRLKNGELFKRYPHITEIKKSLKKGGAHLI
jgi:hypothetical protein